MNSQLAVIVPYRDRAEHLKEFVPHMEKFLQGFDYRLIFIEQTNNKPFNKGKLLNAGFSLVREEARWMCFHDIDMLPKDDSCNYSLPQYTTHLAGRVEQFGYKMPYPHYFGGVLLTLRRDFERINGFSNEYWGWGQEDDDLLLRCLLSGVTISRKPGLYRSLPHEPGKYSIENMDRIIQGLEFACRNVDDLKLAVQIRQHMGFAVSLASSLSEEGKYIYSGNHYDYKQEGLSTLRYELLSRRPLREYAQFDVEISPLHEVITVEL